MTLFAVSSSRSALLCTREKSNAFTICHTDYLRPAGLV
jgi:hypothetical protein